MTRTEKKIAESIIKKINDVAHFVKAEKVLSLDPNLQIARVVLDAYSLFISDVNLISKEFNNDNILISTTIDGPIILTIKYE